MYNRPGELTENLDSLVLLNYRDFEVVIIEDGSSISSEEVVAKYRDQLNINYHYKQNEGPSIGRNVGAQLAQGEYLLFVDSDCIIPRTYLDIIEEKRKADTDVFGGPDRADSSFTSLQKAINFSMTSVLTTGGIRGQKKSVERYYPRSFNLGIKRDVFLEMGGFPKTKMHPGEDMVFGIELIDRGYKTQYIHEAFVYHKRRTSLSQFFKQIRNFGKVRYYITRLYPSTFKLTYLFPSIFIIGLIFSLLGGLLWSQYIGLYCYIAYFSLLFIQSSIESSSIQVGLLSVVTSFYQFLAYSIGLTRAFIGHYIFGTDEFDVIGKNLFDKS